MELCLARLGATGAVWGLGPENQGCGSQGWAAEPQRSVWPSLWFHGFSPSVPGFVYEVWGRMALPFQLLAAQSGRIFQVKGTGLKSCLIFHPQWGLAIHKWQPQRGRKNTTLYVLWSSQETWDCSFHHIHANPQERWRCCHQRDGCCEKRNSLERKERGACTVSKLEAGFLP